MIDLTNYKALFISQKKENIEIFTGFETKNKYAIMDETGIQILFAAEVGSNFFMRNFLKGSRSFEMQIMDKDGNVALKLQRPFKFIFDELTILDPNDQVLGKVQWEFSILKKKFKILGKMGEELCSIVAPVFKPWTFQLMSNGTQIGQITKKWSGALKEMFTNADNFSVHFPEQFDHSKRAILIGALILIDFKYFENNSN
jgi:uncharacterized protein YxjI